MHDMQCSTFGEYRSIPRGTGCLNRIQILSQASFNKEEKNLSDYIGLLTTKALK